MTTKGTNWVVVCVSVVTIVPAVAVALIVRTTVNAVIALIAKPFGLTRSDVTEVSSIGQS